MRTALAILGVAVTLASCSGSSAPSAPAPLDVTGFYDFTATRGTDERTGTLEITRSGTVLDAEAWLTGEPQPALADSVVVDGSRAVLHMLVGGGDEVRFEVEFPNRDAFSGIIVAGPDTIGVTGTRRAQ